MKRAGNFVLFQVGWWVCVGLGPSYGAWILCFAAASLALHLACFSPAPRRCLATVAICAPLGFAIDLVCSWGGWLTYRGAPVFAQAPPWWILSLWVVFASTFDSSLAWLRARPVWAALLGAVGAPLSYLAGERLDALVVQAPRAAHVAAIALAWGAAMPAMLWIAARVGRDQSPKAA